jgi:hypothetical protein
MGGDAGPRSRTPINDMVKVRAALSDARRFRAIWMHALATGRCSVADLLDASTQPGGEPLRALVLTEVLSAQPGWSPRHARFSVAEVRRMLKVDPRIANRRITVGWVVDGRTRGIRRRALADALYRSGREAPAPNWPWVDLDAASSA